MVNPLSRLEQGRQNADESFEHRKVEFTMTQLKLPTPMRRKVRAVVSARTGDPGACLTFSALQEVFPLPIVLLTDRLQGIGMHSQEKCIHPRWFTAFEKLPFFQSFLACRKQYVDSGASHYVGLIVPRQGLKQGLIVHNMSWQGPAAKSSGGHFYRDATGQEIFVQSYAEFIAGLVETLPAVH